MLLRALIIEDSEDDALLLRNALQAGGFELSFRRVESEPELHEALAAGPWDIVFSDHDMPGFDAPAALHILKDSGLDLPFVIVSGHIGEEAAVEALKQGADDYIPKYNLRRLVPAVHRSLTDASHRHSIRRSQALDQLRTAAAASSDLVTLLRLLIEGAENQTGSAFAALGFVIPSENRVQEVGWSSSRHPHADSAQLRESLHLPDSCWQLALRHSAPFVLGDNAPLPESLPAAQRLLFAPALRDGRPAAILTLGDKPFPYSPEDLETASHIAALALDAVERQRAAHALQESEARFRDVVENAPEGIFIQTHGLFRFLNPAASRLFGASGGELVGTPVLDRIHPDFRDQVRARIQGLNEGRQAQPLIQQLFLRLDGSSVAVEVTGVPFHYEGHHGALVFAHDISARKRAEQEKSALEDQLRQAQKLESIGRLAGGIAHDFNNLLTVINGYSDLLTRELRDGDPIKSSITEIRKAGDRAAALTRQLLAFSRKQEIDPRPVDLSRLIADSRDMLRRLLGEEVEFVQNLSSSPMSVLADPGQLNQILLNLCVNARDAMPRGGRLTIETALASLDHEYSSRFPGLEPGPFVRLSVSDTGTGISEEVRLRMFDPFFTTKAEGEGTGLGLSTVYGIVRQARGAIEVHSTLGSGSRFDVFLPALDSSSVEAAAVPTEQAARGSETILLVEDQDEVRRLTSTMLRASGYAVLEAANGGEALLVAERHAATIHLMMTDVVMPRMSGRELADRLAPLRPDMKTLFMSGYTFDVVFERGLGGPDLAYISKPFSANALAAKVREVLGPAVEHQRLLVFESPNSALLCAECRIALAQRGFELLDGAPGSIPEGPWTAVLLDLDAADGRAFTLIPELLRTLPGTALIAGTAARGVDISGSTRLFGGVQLLRKPMELPALLALLGAPRG